MPDSLKAPWPADLKVFAVLSAAWAVGLIGRVVTGVMPLSHAPLQAVIAGMKFHGESARVVLSLEAAILAVFAAGILAERRWGLVLALCYLAEVVMSHFIFILAYLSDVSESLHVRVAALEGPAVVLLLLYLWIRSRGVLFGDD